MWKPLRAKKLTKRCGWLCWSHSLNIYVRKVGSIFVPLPWTNARWRLCRKHCRWSAKPILSLKYRWRVTSTKNWKRISTTIVFLSELLIRRRYWHVVHKTIFLLPIIRAVRKLSRIPLPSPILPRLPGWVIILPKIILTAICVGLIIVGRKSRCSIHVLRPGPVETLIWFIREHALPFVSKNWSRVFRLTKR